MRFTFTDEQRAFQRAVRDFLTKECPPEHVRAMTTDPTGRSPKLWKGLADLGVVGLTVPEEYGGLGGDEIDLILLLQEAGWAGLPEPLLETTMVSVPLLREIPRLRDEWLPRVAAGDAVVTFGRSSFADAHIASLVLMELPGGIAATEPSGMTLTPTRSVDATRRIFEGGVWHTGDPSFDLPLTAARSAFDRGALGAAAILCGIAERMIEMGAAYAKERHQFGKQIGSFQAVKHLLADALLGLEFARPVVYRAAWSVATGDEQSARHVSMAKAGASDAAMNACRAALQVHGAIGYTHEHDLHLWLNKATALAHAWGTAAWHRERIAL